MPQDKTNKEKAGSKTERCPLTPSGLPIDELYNAASVSDYARDHLSAPGAFPFTRGIHPTMYRGRVWTMRQYAGFGTAEEANKRYRYLLAQGQTGLSVAFDLPTQMGRDSDHRLARGEAGKVGVAICSIDDMERLLADIPLDAVSVSMTINATASILLAMLLVVAERRNIAWNKLNGTIQNDILKEYIARGTYIYPPGPALRIVTDIFEFCSREVPQWNTVSISGYHIREAGSTAVEELAFTLADAIAYVDAAVKKGLAVDDFAPRLAFFFNCHNDFLEEIAKFRAARRMWATIMRDRFGAKNPKSLMLRFHTQTAGSSLTAQQPLNNVIRTTVQALAAVLGGTQSLHTNSFDEALGLPTEESALLALRTQQILAHESGVAQAVDPFGGSYLIENWTERLEKEAMRRIEHIDSLGGMLKAIEAGYPQGEIEKSAYAYQQRIEKGEQIIVGMNQFVDDRDQATPIMKMDPQGEKNQCDRLAALRASRDSKAVQEALSSLATSAKEGTNLMPHILNAVRRQVTLGEISDCLRAQFGEYRERSSL
ncbi:MAG: methylmalonyl-CoA mutase [Deltaproteobacteria bacterium]|nr:methylmalonyl-CoA mutase [Deltaproteobacteria bacterium]